MQKLFLLRRIRGENMKKCIEIPTLVFLLSLAFSGTVFAAGKQYKNAEEVSEDLIRTGNTFENNVNHSSEWRFGEVWDESGRRTLTLAQKYCFNRLTGKAAIFYDNDDYGDILFSENRIYEIDTENIIAGYHAYKHTLENGTQVPLMGWKNIGKEYAWHHEGFNASEYPVGSDMGYINPTKYGTWAMWHGVEFHALTDRLYGNGDTLTPYEVRTQCYDYTTGGFNWNSTAWLPVCAICGEVIDTGLHYAKNDAVRDLKVIEIGAETLFTCPWCGGMENTASYGHSCKAISANRYFIEYRSGTSDPNVKGNTPSSVFYYNFANEYEGTKIQSQDRVLANCGFTRPGYRFVGWTKELDGTAEYQPKEDIRTFQDPDKDNATTILYAVWEPVSSYVCVDSNADFANGGGSYYGEKIYYSAGTRQVLSAEDGYDYGAANGFKTNTFQVDESKIVQPRGYIATFDAAGGNSVPQIEAVVKRTGYSCKLNTEDSEWNAFTNIFTFGTVSDTKENASVITILYEQERIILPKATASNKSFLGWYDENGTYVGSDGDEYTLTKNTTLTAKYAQLQLDVEAVYFRQNDKSVGYTEFMNIKRNALGLPDNAAYAPNAYLAVQNSVGATNLGVNATLRADGNTYVYKAFYRKQGDSNWTELDAATSNPVDTSTNANPAPWENPGVYTYTITRAGLYNLTAIGAQGGDFSTNTGGYGGKATGTYYLKEGDVLTITIGGKGGSDGTGGYNGGGAGNGTAGAGGGGATTIVLTRDGVATTLLIGGGGGGATTQSSGYSSNGVTGP